MKIVSVETFLLEKPLRTAMRISRGGFRIRTHLLVRLTTDSGVQGLGEGVGSAHYVKGIIDAAMGRLILGCDPTAIESVRARLLDDQVYYERGGSAVCAASALETACWDIRGKVLGVPVFELLGGLSRERLELYASDVYWEEDPQAMGREAGRIVESGIRTVKAHIGCRPAAEEVPRVKAMRQAIGGDARLMIDLNCGYSGTEAARAARLWDPYDIYWLEEPVAPFFPGLCAEVRDQTAMPIAAGENEFRVHGFRALDEAQAVDVMMPDIGRVGGLQEARDVCAFAAAAGRRVSLHNFSSGVLLAASMHLSAALPQVELLEFDTSRNAVYDELFIEPLTIRDGHLELQQRPGLGVHLPASVVDTWCKSAHTID
jgi:L-alanine-DL-glutamate epimerase-like enolase superfamily enzyme